MFQEDKYEIDELGWQADLQTDFKEEIYKILYQDDICIISSCSETFYNYIFVGDLECKLPWDEFYKYYSKPSVFIYNRRKNYDYVIVQEPAEAFLSDLSQQYLQTVNKQWLKNKIEFYYQTYSSVFDTHSLKKEHDEIFGIYYNKYENFIKKSWKSFPAKANFVNKTITKFLMKNQIWKNKESNNIYYISKLGITESSWEHQNYDQNKDSLKFGKDQYIILEPYRNTSPSKVLKEFNFSEWVYFGAKDE